MPSHSCRIDEYCADYKDLFKEVINYECFKYLHVGIMSPLKRKSLLLLVIELVLAGFRLIVHYAPLSKLVGLLQMVLFLSS